MRLLRILVLARTYSRRVIVHDSSIMTGLHFTHRADTDGHDRFLSKDMRLWLQNCEVNTLRITSHSLITLL